MVIKPYVVEGNKSCKSQCCVVIYSLYLTIVILQPFHVCMCVFVTVCQYLIDLCVRVFVNRY